MMVVPLFNSYENRVKKKDPYFAYTLQIVPVMPISWRKVMINAVQIGDGYAYHKQFLGLEESKPVLFKERDRTSHQFITADGICDALQYVCQSHFKRSLIWLLCRTAPENPVHREADEITLESIGSELINARQEFLDYRVLTYPLEARHYDPQPEWMNRLGGLSDMISQRIQREGIWFPSVNRKKNVAQETAQEFFTYTSGKTEYVRTIDLEVLYASTGVQIGGDCEVRRSWKFNVMKPRLYYCLGGKMYFAARFIKKLAVIFMECIDSTFEKKRSHPELYLNIPDDHYLTAWDFKAFTSTLSEMKFFLSWISRELREFPAAEVRLFDTFKGVLHIHVSDLLDEYNEIANILSAFSVHRLSSHVDQAEHFDTSVILRNQNNGLLGVPGNIGFSTALHGYAICQKCKRGHCVCVGDDGLAATKIHPGHDFIPFISQIGRIEASKFDVSWPYSSEPFRFLKRRFERINGVLYKDELFNFPPPAYIDGVYDSFRTVPVDFSIGARRRKVLTTLSRVLWQVHELPLLMDEEDMDLLRIFLRDIYDRMGFPVAGSTTHIVDPQQPNARMFVPSIFIDFRIKDWLEDLFEKFFDTPVQIPLQDYQIPPYFLQYGVNYRSESPLWSLLEDLGFVKVKSMTEYVDLVLESNRRKVRSLLKGTKTDLRNVVQVDLVRAIPSKYNDVFLSMIEDRMRRIGDDI